MVKFHKDYDFKGADLEILKKFHKDNNISRVVLDIELKKDKIMFYWIEYSNFRYLYVDDLKRSRDINISIFKINDIISITNRDFNTQIYFKDDMFYIPNNKNTDVLIDEFIEGDTSVKILRKI